MKNALISLFLCSSLFACNGYDTKAPKFGDSKGAQSSANDDGEFSTNGGIPGSSGMAGDKTAAAPKPPALSLTLTAESGHDAFEYTFGVAKAEITGAKAPFAFKQSRSIIADSTLSAAQSEKIERLCRDIGLSTDATNFVEANDWAEGQAFYLMWRSHYGADLKADLATILTAGKVGVQCVLTIESSDAAHPLTVELTFDPIALSAQDHAGSSKLDEAVKQGLLLPKAAFQNKSDTAKPIAITKAPQILLNVAALDASKTSVKTVVSPAVEQCYTATSSGVTHVANPYAKNNFSFELSSDLEVGAPKITAKTIGGRLISECEKLAYNMVDKNINFDLSCGTYQAIKDAGLEAGCGWDLTLSNPKDEENSISLPLAMSKIVYKTVDITKADQISALLPRSELNPIRDRSTSLVGFTEGQSLLIEDGLDLWIAVNPESFKSDYAGRIKKLSLGSAKDCGTSAGAFAYFGASEFFWCIAGAIRTDDEKNRLKDPSSMIYRAVTAWHETRHTLNFEHDVDDKKLAPCAGTAAAANLLFRLVTECKFDYCKVMKDMAISEYKYELNYDYDKDATGRKGSGLCKTWSTAMGVSGNGF